MSILSISHLMLFRCMLHKSIEKSVEADVTLFCSMFLHASFKILPFIVFFFLFCVFE
jgi:hypothetical protein